MRMSKHTRVFLLVSALVLAGLFSLRPTYRIAEEVSGYQPNPMDGLVFTVQADHRTADIAVESTLAFPNYFVLDFFREQIHFEVLWKDGWHPILHTKMPFASPTEAVSATQPYHGTFSWRQLVGGILPSGTYRAILYYGDGRSEVGTFHTVTEFTID